jgi:hypothetical protein
MTEKPTGQRVFLAAGHLLRAQRTLPQTAHLLPSIAIRRSGPEASRWIASYSAADIVLSEVSPLEVMSPALDASTTISRAVRGQPDASTCIAASRIAATCFLRSGSVAVGMAHDTLSPALSHVSYLCPSAYCHGCYHEFVRKGEA